MASRHGSSSGLSLLVSLAIVTFLILIPIVGRREKGGKSSDAAPQKTSAVTTVRRRTWRSVCTCLRTKPLLEISLSVLYIWALVYLWTTEPPKAFDDNLGLVGASTVSSALTGALTAASVMLSGTLIGLTRAAEPPLNAVWHIRWAVVFALVSLGAGAYGLASLPSRMGNNLAGEMAVAIVGSVQLAALVFSAFRITFAVFSITHS